MSRILFACYHPLERATVKPVATRLNVMGHSTASLGLFSERTALSHEIGPTFVRPDNSSECASADSTIDLIGELVPEHLPDKRRLCLCKTILSLHPDLDGIFPLRINQWERTWREFVGKVLSEWQPHVVVLSLGQLETETVRETCERLQIPCLYLLTPYYEFKDVERLPITPQSQLNDEFCVASEVGRRKLIGQHVPAEHISMTGAPQFDALKGIQGDAIQPSKIRILMADQGLPEGHRLADRLLRYVREHTGSHLQIRSHPSATQAERQRWKRLIDSDCQTHLASLSQAGTTAEEDLTASSVVVSVSSIMMIEARSLGIPAICWNPGLFPPEIVCDPKGCIPVAKCYSELSNLLNNVQRSRAAQTTRSIENVEHDSGTAHVCNKILSRLMTKAGSPAAAQLNGSEA